MASSAASRPTSSSPGWAASTTAPASSWATSATSAKRASSACRSTAANRACSSCPVTESESLMPPLFPVTLALYAVSLSLYLAHLMAGTQSLARAARIALGAAFASQAVDIGWLCVHGLHPAISAREAMSFAAWLICGAYLALSFKYRVPVVGALVVPVTMVLNLAARLSPEKEPAHGVSTLGAVHITLATAGVALFAVAAGAAVVYLIEERNLKAHRAQKIFKRGAAL